MRSLLIFLAGMLATIILAGVAAFVLVRPVQLDQRLAQDETLTAQLIEPSDRFTISGTIVVPPALKEVIQAGKGRLIIYLASGPQGFGVIPLVSNLVHPTFPYHLDVTLSKSSLAHDPAIKAGISILVRYLTNDVAPKAWGDIYFEPTVIGFKVLPFTEQQILAKQLPSKYEAGAISFRRYYPYTAVSPCLGDKVTLAGKITPTPEFLRKYGKGKFALVLYEESMRGRSDRPLEKENEIAYSQFINFSSGPISFSIPPMKNHFPYFALLAQKCEGDEPLQACAHRAVPVKQFDQNKYRFDIESARLLAPFCGVADYDGVIDKTTYELFHPEGNQKER